MATDRDFYQTLGVSRTAGQDEIQRAYRKLARTYHPDVNKDPGAEDRFKEISEAYDVLSDPDTRSRYDAFGADFRHVPPGVDPATWARARAGTGPGHGAGSGGGRSRGRSPREETWVQTGSGEEIDLEELFGSMFSGRGARGGWGPVAGADQEAVLELTVEEAYQGGRRRITLDGRSYEVNIPAGVTDGQRIRLAGQGGQGGEGGPAGDLYLIIRLLPHPRYRVEGRDIYVDLPLAPWEGALGASVAIDTPGGEAKITIPPGTSTGRRLRLRGRGMPNPRGTPGDLYAVAKIMVPSRLTDAERRLFEQLAATSSFNPRRRS